MKKAFLLIAVVLTLASCGGNSNQNQGGGSASPDSEATTNNKDQNHDDKDFGNPSFCQQCAQLSDNDKVAKIRDIYNSIVNDKNLVEKEVEIEDPESGYPLEYEYKYQNGKLVMVEFDAGDGMTEDLKIYLSDGCPVFCLIENDYPDGTKSFERVYLCDNKIFKYLDEDKKDLDINDEGVQQANKGILQILQDAKQHESKAK